MWQFKSYFILFALCLSVVNAKLDSFSGSYNTELTSIEGQEYEAEDDSDFTIVYDKEDGYRTIPLSEIQADEIIPAFDAARDVRYELFTPKNPNQPQLLTLGNCTTVQQSHFNWLYPTRILIHGW